MYFPMLSFVSLVECLFLGFYCVLSSGCYKKYESFLWLALLMLDLVLISIKTDWLYFACLRRMGCFRWQKNLGNPANLRILWLNAPYQSFLRLHKLLHQFLIKHNREHPTPCHHSILLSNSWCVEVELIFREFVCVKQVSYEDKYLHILIFNGLAWYIMHFALNRVVKIFHHCTLFSVSVIDSVFPYNRL